MRVLLCTLGFISLAGFAFAQTPSAPDDVGTFGIDAGRLGAMMDQSAEALKLLAPNASQVGADTSDAQRAYAFQEIVSAVLRYNAISDQACRRKLVSPVVCNGPYLPAWLSDKPDADHSQAALRGMLDDASVHIVPFWTEMCSKGRQVSHDDTFCAME